MAQLITCVSVLEFSRPVVAVSAASPFHIFCELGYDHQQLICVSVLEFHRPVDNISGLKRAKGSLVRWNRGRNPTKSCRPHCRSPQSARPLIVQPRRINCHPLHTELAPSITKVAHSEISSLPQSAHSNDPDVPLTPKSSSIHGVPCQWDGGCGAGLDDVSPGGIERHLRRCHIEDSWGRQVPGKCKWSQGNVACDRPMIQGSYGKHIASTHLRSTAAMCKKCHGLISRLDAAGKHQEMHCQYKAPPCT
ncbi:hypothetical protein SCP_1500390 [Sparassis crispa]|uniref:Uncharacterized protein n=1 Tax=Sparassis crispa TaxID=139825 RepID=A0A401H3M7_9APHY|nr:hypothetical protein SCP_1500390 [Sparassis crispa]GBE89037.1 hypothetical protein SCP_1500390 [Sparassis crispa]